MRHQPFILTTPQNFNSNKVMKNLFLTFILFLTSIFSSASTSASTEVPPQDYLLYINDCIATAGKQVTLSLCMNNATNATLWQTDLLLPEGITIAKASNGTLDIKKSARATTSHTITANILNNGAIRIMCSSAQNKNFTGNEGEVATITLNIADDIPTGNHTITLRNSLIVETSLASHKISIQQSRVLISDGTYTLGDVNADGIITTADISVLSSHLLGRTPSIFVPEAADVNQDGKISMADLSVLIDMIQK